MGCTTICFVDNAHSVYATNYDHLIFEGYIYVNKKNVSKNSQVTPLANAKGEFCSWSSKYGSVTFNFGTPQFAMGGINEAGLVMTTMDLEETGPPAVDNRHAFIGPLWVQYLLDTCDSVEEVIASDKLISNVSTHNHYMVCDREGNCAVIEFLNGKTVFYTDKTLPIRVLTNSIRYEETINSTEQRKDPKYFQNLEPILISSLNRFDEATERLKNYYAHKVDSTIDYAFVTLRKVRQPLTQWSIVFDTANLKVYFRTKRNKKIRSFNLSSFDFSGATPVKMLNIHENLSGDIAEHFINYSHEIVFNWYKNYLNKYYKINKGKIPSDKILDIQLRYMESFTVV